MKKKAVEYNRIWQYIEEGGWTPEQALEWFRDFKRVVRSNTRVHKMNVIEDLCKGMLILEEAYMNGKTENPSKRSRKGEADQTCSCKET